MEVALCRPVVGLKEKIMNNRLLIVDDVLFMRVTLRTIVEKFGYEVVGEAEDGEEAIAKYQYLKPDAVLLDVTMPKMDGVDCLKVIKHLNPNAKVIMVSAMGQGTFIKQCFKYGAEYFICKPFEEEKLKQVLQAVLPLTEKEPAGEESAFEMAMNTMTIKENPLVSVIDTRKKK